MDQARLNHWIVLIRHGFRILFTEGPVQFLRVFWRKSLPKLKVQYYRIRWTLLPSKASQRSIEPVPPVRPLPPHSASVDVIICVHNAPEDVKRCLASVKEHTAQPYHLVVVDDGSSEETAQFLREYRESGDLQLIRNEQATGYTRASNRGIRETRSEMIVLLNSDTIVTPGWLDRLVDCCNAGEHTGIVGPLANTASYQSIPEYEKDGDWADNPLPPGVTVEKMGEALAKYSARLLPEWPLLNGFCMLFRRKVIEEIGYFDEEHFAGGYGGEDDFNLRARKAGWQLRLADDTYIFHAQSRSYSHEKRKAAAEAVSKSLVKKHGTEIIRQGVHFMECDRMVWGIRARSRYVCERADWIEKGRGRFSGKKILFVLPIAAPGGGGNVIVNEANCMRKMGVDVAFFNLNGNRFGFSKGYPDLDIPVIYGEIEDLAQVGHDFDAIIATHYKTVEWLRAFNDERSVALGYYIQDFEPLFNEAGSPDWLAAFNSYTLLPRMACFTKTDWVKDTVAIKTGRICRTIGASLDIDLMCPRPLNGPDWPNRPLRVTAMVRPASPYREPGKTLQLLEQVSNKHRGQVEIQIFGTAIDDVRFNELTKDFPWNLYGVITQRQAANLFKDADIFVDYSSHQAMGLTAMEAMACGCAVIVPQEGGAVTFAKDGENALVVDTSDYENVWKALDRLISDDVLRQKIRMNALKSICAYYPEKPAFNILDLLFG